MPFFVATAYTILLVINLFKHTKVPLSIRAIPIFVLLSVNVNWLCSNLLYYLNTLWELFIPLLFLSFALIPVLVYQLVFRLTRLRSDEYFPKWHYLMPGAVFLLTLLWTFINRDSMLSLPPGAGSTDMQMLPPDLVYYVIFFRMLITVGYVVPSLVRIHRYRKEAANYSSDEYRISLRWLLILVIIFGVQIVITLGISLFGIGKPFGQTADLLVVVVVALLVWQMTLITYNILNGNFEIVANGGNGTPAGSSALPVEPQELFRRKLEFYLEGSRSYLKPDLRITDLTIPLATNRTYLSAFINETYGMNFCRFINSYRVREYERLRADEKNKDCSNAELALRAGFSNYVSLYRTISYQKEQPC